MILVILGTHERPFLRLLKEIEKLIAQKKIKNVIIQRGYTDYRVNGAKSYDFIEFEKMQRLIKNCDIVITHGGVASITDALNYKKPTIVVPRLKKFNEHTDDHQLQITRMMEKENKIIPVYDIKYLKSAIIKAREFKIKKRKQKKSKIFQIINEKLQEWEKSKIY